MRRLKTTTPPASTRCILVPLLLAILSGCSNSSDNEPSTATTYIESVNPDQTDSDSPMSDAQPDAQIGTNSQNTDEQTGADATDVVPPESQDAPQSDDEMIAETPASNP